MFLLRNLSSRPTSFKGSVVTFLSPGDGGPFGRMSETVFCSFETAAAHAEDDEAVEEKVRLEDRILVACRRK